MVFMLISCQWMFEFGYVIGFMILGEMIRRFWITKILASLLWMPEWFVQEVIVIKLSENLSIPSGHTE